MKDFAGVFFACGSGNYAAQFKKSENGNRLGLIFDSLKELRGSFESHVCFEDMKYCEKIGIEGEHGRCYLQTASMISSMLSVPKVFFMASAILLASNLISIIEPFFSRGASRYRDIIF